MADRPLECSECRKQATVTFVQVSLNGYSEQSLCSDCPLIARLLGDVNSPVCYANYAQGKGICCGNCSTTMERVQVGAPLGCSNCYEVFADVVCAQILKIPVSKVIHCGRSVGEQAEVNPTLRLYALNEALQETLLREEYEEAARIRDEIKSLVESKSQGEKTSSNAPEMGDCNGCC